MRLPTVMLSALMLAVLTGCGTLFGHSPPSARPAIPEVSADLQVCFDHLTGSPGRRGEPLTAAQTQTLIVNLRSSEVSKSKCGRRLLAFIANLGKAA